jgi:sugar (pentulose or hexulose) kinase
LEEAVAVLDVGKTHTKLTLITREGRAVARYARANAVQTAGPGQHLDADGIETWVVASLRQLARKASIVAIVPVAHGAAAALVKDDRRILPVLDYEATVPDEILRSYQELRDPFARTFSPRLPCGLNLGQQLFWQDEVYPETCAPDARILLWPQYWAWRLSGISASEVTSLGCHSDLWCPYEGGFSDLARLRGWDGRLPQLRRANEVLGGIREDLARATGLSPRCHVLCGLHDSNASLVAARGLAEVRDSPFTVLSTGTWFVTLQSGRTTPVQLDPRRDTLANVDVAGVPTPSARFMGGREYELILDRALGATPSVGDAARVVAQEFMAQPSFVAGSGPFPMRQGSLLAGATTSAERAAVASLYLALVTDVCLGLIEADGPLLGEGRFAVDPLLLSALASLRTGRAVLALSTSDGIALGAARLFWPDLHVPAARQVEPLPFDLGRYAEAWSRNVRSQ